MDELILTIRARRLMKESPASIWKRSWPRPRDEPSPAACQAGIMAVSEKFYEPVTGG